MWDCGYDSAFRSGIIVEHSSQDFLRNVKETTVDRVIVRFWISSSVSEIFVVKVKSCLKSRQIFLHVFGPKFFFGKAPKILDQDYKIQMHFKFPHPPFFHSAFFHHMQKFCDDRPRELRDLVPKKNKCQQIISSPKESQKLA